MSSKEAGGFNNTRNREWGKKSAEQGWKSELARREQEAWQNILGTRVEVKPLPDSVTPDVRRNLKRIGFNLRYVPALNIGNADDLREGEIDGYLNELQQRYPGWKPYERLSLRERDDYSVPRNLARLFWDYVRDGDIGFPVLPGQWVAVETLEKPDYGKKYAITQFAEKLGFGDDRFNTSWYDAESAIDRQRRGILSEIGLPRGADLRFLEILEWNLIGNREGWGKTNTYEWTNTMHIAKYRVFGHSRRLIVGCSEHGGAGYTYSVPADYNYVHVGFRAAVVIGS